MEAAGTEVITQWEVEREVAQCVGKPTLSYSAETLKDSFDAFLQSIEPLICNTRLSVGISSIPHPAKVAKGGEDAYFLSDDMKVFGIADGGWLGGHWCRSSTLCQKFDGGWEAVCRELTWQPRSH